MDAAIHHESWSHCFILQIRLHLDHVWFLQFNWCRYSSPSSQWDQKLEMNMQDQLQCQFWENRLWKWEFPRWPLTNQPLTNTAEAALLMENASCLTLIQGDGSLTLLWLEVPLIFFSSCHTYLVSTVTQALNISVWMKRLGVGKAKGRNLFFRTKWFQVFWKGIWNFRKKWFYSCDLIFPVV